MSSILEESRKARGINGVFQGGKKKIISVILILAIAGGAYYYYVNKKKDNTVAEVVKKDWIVKKDNLKIAIQSDGKVVAEDGVDLSFSVPGDTLEVEDVFVKEGQKVKKGDKVASVKSNDLEFSLRSAYVSYQSALSGLELKQVGPTDDEIAKAKISIEQAKVSLDQSKISLDQLKMTVAQKIETAQNSITTAQNSLNLNQNVDNSLIIKNTYDDLVNTLKGTVIKIGNVLKDSDDILGVDNTYVNDDFENLLGVKDSNTLISAKNSYYQVSNLKNDLEPVVLVLNSASNQASIDSVVSKTKTTLNEMEKHLYSMQKMLDATITSSSFTQSELDSFKSTISSNRSTAVSELSSITNSMQSITTSKNSFDSAENTLKNYQMAYDKAVADLDNTKKQAEKDIASAEAGIKSRETSLQQAQISYNELITPVRDIDLASARSQVTSAAISVDKAKYAMEQAILISPIDGEVSLLNYKKGDFIIKSDNKPVASIINNDTLFVEVKIEQADINKIKNGQKAYATFEALDSLRLEGEVAFVSLTSATDNNGIVTYVVRVVVNNNGETKIREGMTAQVDFVTAEKNDILIVPVTAVRNVNNKPSVELPDGTWAPVVTGFTDGINVEIISGLKAGDKLVY
ncbi:efflux RND transporter periplasmic adaptor subunit [Candidatus Parcubacteria bacterium]|nr:efflux RND transporter periplasmic adaptor subunit [Patescibacteria group bacterium]MBU4308913.1 efflux RND transporter periplasmic adaptor subunit [Patescibacteria group bacterium]MBU4432585.1 efflux RND transporter periplasmic adaptor subunit [Patescibacteria group bacterium]MBU4577273.1 efflux RND transporter periplasmic adaptor subunit [Patescibacteria group bacterium]MCG2696963.1 efflux RND transporter periplasmic adaptor subunit [Candidatus Parcubacteria bacterium]